MFVVCVDFTAKPEDQKAFEQLVKAQATNSLKNEPACLRFDVCIGNSGAIFLYEIYQDEDAFAAHLETQHFKDFDDKAQNMIENKAVRTYRLAEKED